MRPPILAALLAAALGGCAASASHGGAGRCEVRALAHVQLADERGYLAVPAAIEDKPVTMLIDTGSDTTLVTPSAVRTLGLGRDPHASTTINGNDGSVTSRNALLQSFGVGGMEMLDQSYAVAPLPTLGLAGYQAAGLIGADWLSQFDVDLDVPGRRLTLYRAQGCGDDHVPWPGAHVSVPAFRAGRDRVIVDATLDGTRLHAMIDSGANQSLVSRAAAARAGVTVARMDHDPRARTSGMGGVVDETRVHRFATLDVGGVVWRDPALVVGALSASTGADMLLGLDWLRSHEIWIDYRDRRVFIRAASAPGG
ncbi:retroviral-like aspartic protease family protein [Acidisphaera rubrifaciens]|uniref:Peptidase A2 domain-containing protein n=1 Tax=Acidisphaera rubrifaciens HS-AP3 TaxID=1231350 RepID=A0A0D6P7L9_9PROT|nr:retroviral-like aspartic protease family protein [Acidisphaera rubrifaciens]GAN77341.1 hypothetical protein Asru_0287_06 [Acidisphaera rubrifaciens HS-AP3]